MDSSIAQFSSESTATALDYSSAALIAPEMLTLDFTTTLSVDELFDPDALLTATPIDAEHSGYSEHGGRGRLQPSPVTYQHMHAFRAALAVCVSGALPSHALFDALRLTYLYI
ncbi:hypothetical protein FISHEDRAFT_75008 [Fistulina hepatica ATCC 64428]|uniref:Uncharacterized protein n=1 Tax=Fistulina hepatica ATCC 64428 TaxID=1128425 RepID=A0A0D7A7U7_9AGAR|nr:hypothetical protein FISHEDRAFT_75008 [Fistulina hepatica ATCC 64428]